MDEIIPPGIGDVSFHVAFSCKKRNFHVKLLLQLCTAPSNDMHREAEGAQIQENGGPFAARESLNFSDAIHRIPPYCPSP